jgi:hypothetical protein
MQCRLVDASVKQIARASELEGLGLSPPDSNSSLTLPASGLGNLTDVRSYCTWSHSLMRARHLNADEIIHGTRFSLYFYLCWWSQVETTASVSTAIVSLPNTHTTSEDDNTKVKSHVVRLVVSSSKKRRRELQDDKGTPVQREATKRGKPRGGAYPMPRT